MSDSDDSDIGDLMAQVKRKTQQNRMVSHTNNDASDESSGDENEIPYLHRSKRNRTLDSDKKLERMTNRFRERKIACRSDSSDDESGEEDVVVRSATARRRSDRNAIKVNVEIVEVDEETGKPKADDSMYLSSDEECTVVGKANLRRGRSAKTSTTVSPGTKTFHETFAALQNAQRETGTDTKSPGRRGARPLLEITVDAKTHTFGSSDILSSSFALEIYDNESVKTIIDKFHVAAGLNPKTTTMHLTFKGKRLVETRSAASYDLSSGDSVEANVVLTNFTRAEAKQDLGKTISLVLRRVDGKADEKDVVKVCQKQPFQFLLDEYRKLKCLPPTRSIVLKFDGERLRLDKTPESEDMDDEDLVDVVIS